ncbi:MAG TPA: hypothetical protein VNO21_20980, partial [Polyangiaceae bacterium]|nr:hypothetical protein [Polyangiaceae bacterium]
MKRTWMFGIPTILLGVFSPDAEASTLHEWTLHERSAPLQIDGQHLANQVFFLDLGVQSIDRLNPVTGELEEWHPSTFVGGTPSSIEVDEAASPPVVFVSDPSSQQIGRLAPPNVYSYWPVAIPPIYQLRVLAVERVTGNVLFTSYDGVHAPVVASFDPARGTGRACILPPDAGEPSDRLDGIVALPSPATAPVLKAYFSVVGTKHRSIDLLDFSASTVTVWPVPLVDAGQIALTKTGQIASVLDGASSIAQLLDTSLSKY